MPRLSQRERLRRERIARALRAYYREQRRLREARAEAARRYWRRVKAAAGRHQLTVPQARRAVRIADQLAIPVTTAARRIKRIPRPAVAAPPVLIPVPTPAPPVPPREVPPEEVPAYPEEPTPPSPAPGVWASSEITRQEIAWNLRDVVERGYEVDPRDVMPRTGTLQADFNVFVDGIYRRTQTVTFESSADPDAFWFNFHAAAREVHEETMDEEVDYDQISITAMAIRMA